MKIFTLSRLTRSGPAQKLAGILAGLLLLFSLTIGSSPTFAQGSCSCEEWQGPERLICIPVDTCADDFIPSEDSCPTEFAAPYGCKEGATCTCVLGSAAPCTEAGGYCLVSCGPDYDSYPPGDPECVAAGRMCCRPAEEEPPEEDGGPSPIPVCVPTPIGCIPTDLGAATAHLFGVVVDILAALAIIVFIAGGVQVMASGDDPEGLQEGKKKMTAAVSGFFFLLLFVVIIDMIGIRMLGISVLREVIKHWLP